MLENPHAIPPAEPTDEERYLESVLEGVTDLSSYSEELDSHIHDWSTEYHLSRKRGNLLRGFDLSKLDNVLEFGCGCGSITRLLGEQGIAVDAIEDSTVKARLAALRCRDLSQVRVYNARFNDLAWPKGAYDAVVLVGIFACAISLVDDAKNSTDAVRRILTAAARAVKEDGVIIIATENRLGMKYVLGANEEHRGRRYVGIHGYFGESEINTYSRQEWEVLLEKFGFNEIATYLPFPDFKIPTVILAEEYTLHNPHAFCHLEGMSSRDYIVPLDLGVSEPMFWQSSNLAGTMSQHSNSFLFVCSPRGRTAKIGDHDFIHLPNFSRKIGYCVIANKPKNDERVVRHRLLEGQPTDCGVRQKLLAERYHRGPLLSTEWIRALLIEPDSDRFVDLVRKYLEYLETVPTLTIDLLPKNIVIDAAGGYRAFDQEWESDQEITPAFLAFRALLSLPMVSVSMLRPYFTLRELGTIRDFIVYIGNEVGLGLESALPEFARLEEEFQNCVARSEQTQSTLQHLETRIVSAETAKVPTRARVYWRCEGEGYDTKNMKTFFFDVSDEIQTIRVKLPPAAGRATHLRFDPCDEERQSGVGFMRFHSIRIACVDPSHDPGDEVIWGLEGQEEIARNARLSGIIHKQTGRGTMFAVTDDDPWFEFAFSPQLSSGDNNYLEVTLSVSMPVSEDYLLAKDAFLAAERSFEEKLANLDDAYSRIGHLEEELSRIKASRSWKAITALKDLVNDSKARFIKNPNSFFK